MKQLRWRILTVQRPGGFPSDRSYPETQASSSSSSDDGRDRRQAADAPLSLKATQPATGKKNLAQSQVRCFE